MKLKTLFAIEAVGSRLEKERLLSTVDAETVAMLKWALDPMITFGVTFDEEYELQGWRNRNLRTSIAGGNFWGRCEELLTKLSRRDLTGNAAANAIRDLVLVALDEDHVIWLGRILNKDPRIGVQVSTLNNVFPGTIIKEVPCALAQPYDADKHELLGEWIIQPKLDGLRMVVMDGIARTRNGRVIESVDHIVEELMSHGGDQFVYDGEIMGATSFDEDSGKIRKKGAGPNMSLVYNCFDFMPRADWIARGCSLTLRERDSSLFEWFGHLCPKYTRQVKSQFLPRNPTPEQLFKARDELIAKGYEGAMLKDLDSLYVFKRSDSVLKLKNFTSIEGTISHLFEGKGKYKGKLGGFFADFEGVETRVGGGFNDKQREELWAKRGVEVGVHKKTKKALWSSPELQGKCIETQHQLPKSKDGALRFPVFLKFRPDRDIT